MAEIKQSSGEGIGAGQEANQSSVDQLKKKKKKWTNKSGLKSEDSEVLLKVGSLEYKAPGRRQRVVLGSIVLGGNLLLVLAVTLYFYNPSFKEFITTVGK